MPPVRLIDTYPAAIRTELERRACEAGFGDIRGLTDWLNAEGYQIGKSAVGEWVGELKEDFEQAMGDVRRSVQIARMMVDADPDEQAVLSDATVRLNTDTLLRVSVDLRKAGLDPDQLAPLLSQIARASADLARVSIAQRKHSDVVRRAQEEARAAALKAAAEAGVDAETADKIASGIRIYLPDNQRTGARG